MLFDKIQDIIVEQLGVAPEMVTTETNLIKDLEADSLDAVEIILAIEEEFEIEISDEEAETIQTVQDLVNYVETKTK
jgi:acyl carrier protein